MRALGGDTRNLSTPATFYSGVRGVTGPLDQVQVEVIESLLKAASRWSTSWLAYGLATAWHEARLRPIEEIGKGKGRPYGQPGKYGQAQYGRGLVQLTWDRNYERADKELNLGGALLKDFGLALKPQIATEILVRGMEEAWFTGKGLGDYLPAELGTVVQFTEARRIINGTDRAAGIAEYARRFQDALVLGGWG
ncbi:hypothetical protein KFK14_17740 [Sphingobium phenoxybenzoativorans]|uniref:Glycoside hydrolase family 19 catalytic domain-containing protein n=1 Tax=Sphingobium phenoxybenzoativorans TaxID=1592790 RepID=A0A975Q0L0_9SPHN|nr:hypothetical protein [Sphingobium phenoxybenzoativorans]QUT04854.1 hypothetical protein KFK14_17740 [Sphingobium phenoxybenzoativorans]